ncbi:cytochrome C peroxidase [Hahella sp. CCB-MM4]|uniref:cytochrome-c peroxidase n=1 Tax=Hahella sp. (strain CCB-MM4) TaxID=1926491 RepID=UPI000B9B3088|nr:cytochrome c peroxidase [Hahella sp. CCB-MM4]OZG73011.1 cytochrome C peroxidase [Hahella sp. CCB-MM4]
MLRRAVLLYIGVLSLLCQSAFALTDDELYQFTPADKEFLSQFNITDLGALPEAPDNKWADNEDAANLGKALFFDNRLSKNQQVSCSHCHQPDKYFTDGLAHSNGIGQTRRSAPSILGIAYSPWMFWDGRRDSLWAQALGPMEHPDEQGLSRGELARNVLEYYPAEYEAIFGKPKQPSLDLNDISLPASPAGSAEAQSNWNKLDSDEQDAVNRIFTNVGKALMAYQRKLKLPPAPFDQFIDALNDNNIEQAKSLLTPSQVRGLRLFMGQANCSSCHNGPLFTNHEFHNIGAPEANVEHVDLGRFEGVSLLREDEFTCLSSYSDASSDQCKEMRFLKVQGPELVGAIKTPTLRNVAATAPYMQAGQFETLQQVLAHYNKPTPPYYDRKQHPSRPHFDVLPLNLQETDLQDIEDFLHSLTSPLPAGDHWWPVGETGSQEITP